VPPVRGRWTSPAGRFGHFLRALRRRVAEPWLRRAAIRELRRVGARELRDAGIEPYEIDELVDDMLARRRRSDGD
jgi:uncharacterized protein YjiS (DUF1127 family)